MKTTSILRNALATGMIFFSSMLLAQDNARLDGFTKSYEQEKLQNYDEAIKSLDKVYDANWYEANLRLGWLWYMKGDYNKSKTYYSKAAALSPKSVEARLGLVYPVSAMGNWDEVVTIYEDILKIDPNNSLVNYRLALIWYNRKKHAQALPYVKKVLELYPFDYDSNLLAGKIHIGLANITEAKAALNKALLYSPSAAEPAELLKGL